jgi:hypothetical protein
LRDPDDDEINLGTYRVMIHDKKTRRTCPVSLITTRCACTRTVFMPAGFMLLRGNFESGGREGIVKTQAWFTPIDDTNPMRINVGWGPGKSLLRPISDQMVPGKIVSGGTAYGDVRPVTKDYYRDYDNVDTIHGIPMKHFRS